MLGELSEHCDIGPGSGGCGCCILAHDCIVSASNSIDEVGSTFVQVMSGSGDLEVLRLVRRLRVRVGHPEVHYGSHLATHMALGLLFMGGGRSAMWHFSLVLSHPFSVV